MERALHALGAWVLVILITIGALGYILSGGRGAPLRPRLQPGSMSSPADPSDLEEADDDEGEEAVASAGGVCTVGTDFVPLEDGIRESSGVAASWSRRGTFWTHNDSGDPVVFGVDSTGRTVATVALTGAEVTDWEDVAVGPCPGGTCIYVADIGDNDAARPEITVWRAPEPAAGATRAPATGIRLRYPDGPQDAEAMFIAGGRIYVVSKGETGPASVYRAPAGNAGGALEKLRVLLPAKASRPDRITGASASPDGQWVALRTLRSVSVYPFADLLRDNGSPAEVVDLRPAAEPQGEAVAFVHGGDIVLTSEGGQSKEAPASMRRLACRFSRTPPTTARR